MLQLEIPNVVASEVLERCLQRGLEIRLERKRGNPMGRHWHLGRRGINGTLEVTEAPRAVYLKVHPLRDGGWASATARQLARELRKSDYAKM